MKSEWNNTSIDIDTSSAEDFKNLLVDNLMLQMQMEQRLDTLVTNRNRDKVKLSLSPETFYLVVIESNGSPTILVQYRIGTEYQNPGFYAYDCFYLDFSKYIGDVNDLLYIREAQSY